MNDAETIDTGEFILLLERKARQAPSSLSNVKGYLYNLKDIQN